MFYFAYVISERFAESHNLTSAIEYIYVFAEILHIIHFEVRKMYVFLRTVAVYIIVIVYIRIMGKRHIGELRPSELVTAIMISNLITIPIENDSMPVFKALIPSAVIVALEIIISTIESFNPHFSRLVSGNDIILINNGKIDRNALSSLRLGMGDIICALHGRGIFDIREVRYAVIETNGQMSVLCDRNRRSIPLDLIVDGYINDSAIKAAGKDKKWLESFLNKVQKESDNILLLQYCSDDDIWAIEK